MKQVAWAERLPLDWAVKPLRSVSSYVVSNVDKVSRDHEIPIRLCNYKDVYRHEFITLSRDFMRGTASEAEVATFGLSVGDVIITKDSESWNDIGVPALVTESSHDLVCGYHLALLRPFRHAIDGRFLLRCLQAKPIRVQLELGARGVTRFGIPKATIGAMKLPVPPLTKQRLIADYLDRETARLDSLFAEKERVLHLLAERRNAIIARAVTRGLNPDVPLRDSGTPWLGGIPKHWDTERARWLFTERDQRSTTGEEVLLTVSHLTGVTPRSQKNVNMFEAATKKGYKVCIAGDLVVNTMWAWMGAMGIAQRDGIVSPAYNVYKPKARLAPGYLAALTRLPSFAQEVTRYSKGVWSSRLRLYPQEFFSISLPVPPLSEQRAIATQVDRWAAELDELHAATQATMTLLKERRLALIAAAVSGHLKVEA